MRPRFLPPLASACLAFLACAALAAPGREGPAEDIPASGAPARRTCGTPEATPAEMEAVMTQVGKWVGRYGAQAVGGRIQVAWHVIHNGSEGDIPQWQIDAQIAELNRAYSGFYGGANTRYTFVLASVDRTLSRRWFRMTPGTGLERQAKNALAVDPAHRLNIYSCKPGQNLLGWAVFPWSYPESSPQHGVVIHYGSVPGGYLAPYDLGGTADHEVGHYLGLYHTFQGGCAAPGDQVADTPDEATPTSGCPEGKDTCPTPGLDPIHNYMDYSTDACYTELTAGQDARMDAIVPTYRPSLLNAALLAFDPARSPGSGDAGQAAAAGRPGAESAAPRPTGASVEFRGAFPNPFRDETLLRFYLPAAGRVSLELYDVAGQRVESVLDGELPAGEHVARFRARERASGIYFATLRAGDGRTLNRTVILVR